MLEMLFNNPIQTAMGSLAVTVASFFMGKYVKRSKLEIFYKSIRFKFGAYRDVFFKFALVPFFGFGIVFSKFIASKIGNTTASAFEEKIVVTLLTIVKTTISIAKECLLMPLLDLPEKVIERFEAGMLNDNAKKDKK